MNQCLMINDSNASLPSSMNPNSLYIPRVVISLGMSLVYKLKLLMYC